jgi:hypothetical protein
MLPSSRFESPLPSSRNTCAVVMKRLTRPPATVVRKEHTVDRLSYPQLLMSRGKVRNIRTRSLNRMQVVITSLTTTKR